MAAPLFLEAAALAGASGGMLAVSVGAMASQDVISSTLRHRSLGRSTQWRSSVWVGARAEIIATTRTPLLLVPSPAAAARAASQRRGDAAVNVTLAASIFVVAVLAGIATFFFALRGRASVGELLLVCAVAVGALLLARRLTSADEERSLLARRIPHVAGVAVVTEIAILASTTLAVQVVLHTAGVDRPVLDVLVVALLTRLVARLAPTPAAVGVADVAMIVVLIWLGVPIVVAVACSLVWRLGMLVGVGILSIAALRVSDCGDLVSGPQDSDSGRPLHRLFFGAIGLLPLDARRRVRRMIFEGIFTLAADPWSYDDMPYEQRKRSALSAALDTGASVVLELGTADGHNLRHLARHNPHMTFVGVDISPAAIATARSRSQGIDNVSFTDISDDPDWKSLEEYVGRVDVLVLAEVLYYFGGETSTRAALKPVRRLLAPSAQVVMLHGAADAHVLHTRAQRSLGLGNSSEMHHPDPERPFELSVSQRTC
jgi:uncharacterized membrane protein YbhN (UPF0104 family)